MPAADGKTPFWSAFRNPGYRTFWIGAFVSNIGAWMQNVAQGWLVLELTDSAFMLGLVGFAGSLPWLVLLLVGGVYADRLDRRRLLIRANLGMMACAAILTALTWTGAVRIWHVFALSLASGSAIALAAPAFQAFLFDLVDRRDLQNAIALNSAQFNLSRIVGPSLAGLTLGVIGLAGCFGVNTLSYLGAIAALMLIRVASRPVPAPAPVWDSIVEGFGYVRERPRIQALLSIAALISLLAMPYATLLPIVVRDGLGLDASGLGWLFAVGGGGAVCGALSIAFPHLLPSRGPWLLGCAIATGLATMTLGLARSPLAAAIALVAIGFSATSAVALTNTLLQELVDDAMRGRVLSMFGLAFMGTFPVANLLAGTLAGLTSASVTLAVTGALLAIVVGAIAWARPRLRALE
ncbi:MAG TPA: MFS transporter [Gemmatimonadota bacterium]|jgi:MFS family permease|nr:MFS transporter [Gemmatimonadota bacterium]